MKYSILFFAAMLFMGSILCIPARVHAAGACGSSVRVYSLLHEAIYAEDRAEAESRLISGVFPVVTCLSRENVLVTPSGIPGRFAMVLEVLGALRKQTVRMSTIADVDRQIRLWQVGLAGAKGG